MISGFASTLSRLLDEKRLLSNLPGDITLRNELMSLTGGTGRANFLTLAFTLPSLGSMSSHLKLIRKS